MEFFGYIKEAFKNHYNLLLLGAGFIFSAMSGFFLGCFSLVIAAEILYLTTLASTPRFQRLIRSRINYEKEIVSRQDSEQKLSAIMSNLDKTDKEKFRQIRNKCKSFGKVVDGFSELSANQIPDIDRLLWIYLKLLVAKKEVSLFLENVDAEKLKKELKELQKRHDAISGESEIAAQKRIVLKDLTDSARKRLENVTRTAENYEVFELKLEQIESRLNVLSEQSIGRNDPNSISNGVDTIVNGVELSENTIADLTATTGIKLNFEEAPSILSSDFFDNRIYFDDGKKYYGSNGLKNSTGIL